MRKAEVHQLRVITLIEGLSFLALLFIAMPMKYLANLPMAVKIAGWIHGVLFILFCLALVRAMATEKWPLSRAALVFIAALIPFGPFFIDRKMQGYEQALE